MEDKTLNEFKELADKIKDENLACWHEPQGVCPRCGYCPHCGRGGQQMPYYPAPCYPWYKQPYYYDDRLTYASSNTGTLKIA